MKIKYNIKAFEEIRRLPAVAAEVDSRAAPNAHACGDGYESSPYEGRSRHRASVITSNYKAARDNAKNNTLLRNINAGS